MKRIWLWVIIIICSAKVCAQQSESIVSTQEITEVLDSLKPTLKQHYIYPEAITNIEQKILEQRLAGKLIGAMPLGKFKIQLEQLLVEATNDSSFELLFHSGELTGGSTKTPYNYPDKFSIATEIMDNDIGYISLTGNFLDLRALPDIRFALSQLKHCKALILDISQVGEGNLQFIQHLSSYWLSDDTVLTNLTFNPATPAEALLPIMSEGSYKFEQDTHTYIITSPFVIGAWELFSYSMQQQGRAEIVGKQTMGLARLTKPVRLSQQVWLNIAYAMPSDPISKQSWQGVGVLPDHDTAQNEAPEVAYKLALQAITKQ